MQAKRYLLFLILLIQIAVEAQKGWSQISNACDAYCYQEVVPKKNKNALNLCSKKCISAHCYDLIYGDIEVGPDFDIDESWTQVIKTRYLEFKKCYRMHPEWVRKLPGVKEDL